MKHSNSILQEIGINVINPDTHFLLSGEERNRIKKMLTESYGESIVTEELVDAFVETEEMPYIMHSDEEHGVIFGDRMEHMDDRAMLLTDYAYSVHLDPLSRYYTGL